MIPVLARDRARYRARFFSFETAGAPRRSTRTTLTQPLPGRSDLDAVPKTRPVPAHRPTGRTVAEREYFVASPASYFVDGYVLLIDASPTAR